MKRIFSQLFYGFLILFSFTNIAHAGVPVWTFTPNPAFPPQIAVNSLVTNAFVQYTVTNQSSKIHSLRMQPITGITSTGCSSPLGPYQSCTLTLSVKANALKGNITAGPVLCEQNNPLQCYQPNQPDVLSIRFPALTASAQPLALSINCLPNSLCTATQNSALTGNARTLIIQNTSGVEVTNMVVHSAGFPLGTDITNNTCTGNLLPGASCGITITPGNVANLDANNQPCTRGTQPVKSVVSVMAGDGLSSNFDVYVLGYGCQYQGGYVFSVDDTTIKTSSIGGKVASLVNQATPSFSNNPINPGGVIWSSNGLPGGVGTINNNFDNTIILGIDQTSTPSTPSPTTPPYPTGAPTYAACSGAYDGTCDANNIVSFYNFYRANGGAAPTPLNLYAAGLCRVPGGISGYTDWYLPAICELGFAGANGAFPCTTITQNMQSSLAFLITPAPCSVNQTCLSGIYWSSTETLVNPSTNAWFHRFNVPPAASARAQGQKRFQDGVRCIRALTTT